MDEKPKTYFARQRESKRRVELFLSVLFLIGVNLCYALSTYYFEDAIFWDSLKQSLYGTLMLMVIMILSLPLIFACLFVGRLITKKQNKKKYQ